tara:strand:- start:126 stop:476 length:351 start_codon:yes stop_codon:yes gene_type:complete
MTKKQRVALWRRMSQCFDRHERTMIEQNKKSRIDIIGQNGNDGEHYAELEKEQLNSRGNWYGLADDWDESDEIEASKNEKTYKVDGRHPEPDATGAEEDLPSAAEDCAKQRGNYEI